MTTAAVMDFDVFDPEVVRSPWDAYRRLRDDAPAFHVAELDLWLVTRYDTVFEATRQPALWSSADGNVYPRDNPVRTGRTLGTTDPPRHEELRRLIAQSFTPRRIAMLEDRARLRAVELLSPLVEHGRFDFVNAFAGPFTAMVIGEILGVPESDLPLLRGWVDARFGPDPRQHVQDREDAEKRIFCYLGELVAERRRRAADDVVSGLIAAEEGGARLDDLEIVTTCGTILSAGYASTKHAVVNLLVTLVEHPEAFAAVTSDLALIPQAFEETLRYTSPAHTFGRTITAPVEVHGTTIPAGARIALSFGSANRDERAFDNPDVFDLHRDRERRHVGFGLGVHHCLGAALARLEARVAFETLLPAVRSIDVGEPWRHLLNTLMFRGYEELHCEVERR